MNSQLQEAKKGFSERQEKQQRGWQMAMTKAEQFQIPHILKNWQADQAANWNLTSIND